MKRALLAATILALPLAARAQPVTGIYVGAGAGGNFMQPSKVENIVTFSGPGAAPGYVTRDKINYDTGFVGVGSVGYGFGNGIRIEAEGDYRYNHFSNAPNGTAEEKYGGMANAFFDFDIGSPYVWPYAGLGVGYMHVEHGYSNVTSNAFAGQAIGGVSIPIPWVLGLSATLEYRFMALASSKESSSFASPPGTTDVTQKFYNNLNHSLLLGLRYAFYVPPPPTPPAAPAPAPPPQVSRSYLVFFDWDRADLTARARQIIAEAAQNVAHVQHTRIEVDGHTDTSGTPQYNQGLSVRRAQTVAAELVRLGVAKTEIDIHGYGDTRPLVATGPGVREPQNRRVEIIYR